MHNNIVSTYDLYMNRKIGSGHRQWDRNFMVWLPEAIDQPVIGKIESMRLNITLKVYLQEGIRTLV